MVKPTTPENLSGYVEVLGEDLAIEFFLTFGGAPVYLAVDPKSRSSVVAAIGRDKAVALADRLGAGHLRVPTAKRWIAQRLADKGTAVVAIARRLHVSDVTVRAYLKAAETQQLSLFG